MWILLVVLYGTIKGFRDVVKKKALQANSVMEVLFVYTFIAFLFSVPDAPYVINTLPTKYYFLIMIKSLAIFIAWICSFKAIDNVPISIYGVIDLSRIVFSTVFGVLVLHESTSFHQKTGLIVIIIGLLFLKLYPSFINKKNGNYHKEFIKPLFIIMIFISCILNALSGCLDKIFLMDVSSKELQFWYMFYLTIFYGLYFVIRRIKIDSTVWKNKWIYLLSLLFFIGDRALFIANENPASKVTIMTLLKQSACIISILSGKFIFKEKNISYKLISAVIILSGIVFSVMG